MNWEKAIKESPKGTCIREVNNGDFKITTIKYKDGSGYNLVASGGKMDHFLSRPATEFELEGFNDWTPSK
jgi:hypothetical protein